MEESLNTKAKDINIKYQWNSDSECIKQLSVFCMHIPMCLLKINLYPFDGDFFLCMQSGRVLSFKTDY